MKTLQLRILYYRDPAKGQMIGEDCEIFGTSSNTSDIIQSNLRPKLFELLEDEEELITEFFTLLDKLVDEIPMKHYSRLVKLYDVKDHLVPTDIKAVEMFLYKHNITDTDITIITYS
jgi:hypothetical protein